MKLKVKTPFKWAHQGVRVEEFEAGQVIETDDQDLIDVSQEQGWTVRPRNRTKADGTEAPEGTDGADGTDATDGAAADEASDTEGQKAE